LIADRTSMLIFPAGDYSDGDVDELDDDEEDIE
jgi:hypothetical protein